MTELGLIPFYKVAPEDWEYFHSNQNLKGLEFRHLGEELYELVIVRHPSTDVYHSAFFTFPELTEFPLNGLHSKHPTNPNYWLYVGRTDDVIVLSNGEKLSPVAMEAALRDHLSVNEALIVGQGKFSAAAIIELRPDVAQIMKNAEDRASFIESLWPYAVAANEKSPAHTQLAKERIMIAAVDKLFLRAGKGTVQRGATVKNFEHEIEELYEQTEGGAILNLPKINLDQESTALQQSLLDFVDMVTSLGLVTPDQDFFSAGMDSLQVMKLAKHLKSAFVENAVPRDKINTRIIYTNPSLATLADTLKTLRYGVNGFIEGIGLTGTRESKMNEMLLKYLNDLPASTDKKLSSSQESISHLDRE